MNHLVKFMLPNGKIIILCMRIFTIEMFVRFFGLIEAILVSYHSLGLACIPPKSLQISKSEKTT